MNRSTASFGVVLIVVGLILLVALQLGLDAWRIFWPTIIIVVGLWMLWGAASSRGRVAEVKSASLALQGASLASVRLRHGAGRLHVAAGAGPGELFSGTFGGGVEVRSDRRGEALEADLSVPAPSFFFPFPWLGWRELEWNVRLNETLPLVLRVESGASETHLDLTNLRVTELRVGTGASSTEIKLPSAAGTTTVRIEAGAASVKLWVPAGVAARIRAEAGLSDMKVDRSRFPRQGVYYQSPDYETAANKADVTVQMGVGSVEVH
jgi:predicted membrane protein